MSLSKSRKTLVIVVLVICFIIMGGVVFFLVKKSQANKSPTVNEDKKFFLHVVFKPNSRHPWKGECLFSHSKKNTGFRISSDHPALQGVELKEKSFYLVEGAEKFLLSDFASKNKIGMSDKITITPL